MFLAVTAVLFALFASNVVLGAANNAAPLGNVGEMLLLLAASITFVIAILGRESARADAEAAQAPGSPK